MIRSRPPAHALVVLQLADDLDVLALLTQHLPHSVDVRSFADEGGKHHVHALLHTKLQVLHVFLRHSRQVHSSSGQVHAFLAAQRAAVADGAHQEVAAWRRRRVKLHPGQGTASRRTIRILRAHQLL